MMRRIFLTLAVITPLLLSSTPVAAQSTQDIVCQNNPDASQCRDADVSGAVASVVEVLLIVVGAGAVIMVIVGGFRYVVSAGDPKATQGAKNTILYALVGVAVAFIAYALVNEVFGRIT